MAELSSEHSAEVEWIVHRVKGQHFLKSRTVQIGDTVLTSKKSNIRNTDINNSNDQLPRSWTRLLSSFIKLRQLNASSNQISHYLHFQIRSLFDDEARHFLHLLENGKFGRFYRNLSQSDIRLIREILQNEIHCRCNAQIDRFKSCADSSNRKRDKKRTECELFLAELGSKECNIHFFNATDRSQLIAVNYERVVYGDHGPYIEFDADEIEWSAFAVSDAPSKGDSVAYYDEYFNVGKQKNVKLYAQKKTVCDQPNPPKGKYAQNHNRSNGYADYKVGFFYISPDHLCVDLSDNKICPYLYLLSNNKQQRNHQNNLQNVQNTEYRLIQPTVLRATNCLNRSFAEPIIHFKGFAKGIDFTHNQKIKQLELRCIETLHSLLSNGGTLIFDGDSFKNDSFTFLIPKVIKRIVASGKCPNFELFAFIQQSQTDRFTKSWQNVIKVPNFNSFKFHLQPLSHIHNYIDLGVEGMRMSKTRLAICFGGGNVVKHEYETMKMNENNVNMPIFYVYDVHRTNAKTQKTEYPSLKPLIEQYKQCKIGYFADNEWSKNCMDPIAFCANMNEEKFEEQIEIFKAPKINTREGKRVMNACVNGTYIPGLIYVDGFISEQEQIQIRQQILDRNKEWKQNYIKTNRKWLQFGYFLDYKNMELYKNKEKGFEHIPTEWQWIGQRIQSLMEKKLNTKCKEFNQLIINAYSPNEGINDHTDRTHCFGPIIAGLSLFSSCVIQFKEKVGKNKNVRKPVLLKPRSLFVMTGPSRYEWLHGIDAKREHKFCGQRIKRGHRYSMTFRHALDASSEVLPQQRYNALSAQAMNVEQ